MQFLRRLLSTILIVVLGVFLALILMEIGFRVFSPQVHPVEVAHDVLYLDPDPVSGWIHPKNFDFFWNGRNPYCIEFGINVSMNNFGFRADDWTVEKPKDTIRIAVIGDSFIEALQVPEAQTAVKLLEIQLRAAHPDQKIEVMNFGTSNHGVGQYLMVYDEYAKQFQPDYVVIFVAYLHFRRTTQRDLLSGLQKFYTLNVRPSYEIGSDGNLVYLPAKDYDEYVSAVDELIDTQFGEDRSIEIRGDTNPFYFMDAVFTISSRTNYTPPPIQARDTTRVFPDVDLNYRIIQELNNEVQAAGSQMIFVDTFDYMERYAIPSGSGVLVERNKTFIESLNAGYIDLSPALRAANHIPQFVCDVHFTPTGNQILADTLFDWFDSRW
jgi:hypothetical protein